MPPLGIVEVLESKEDTPTPENVSKPSKEQSDQILRCSTSLVSVNTSLALERVWEQGVATLCAMLESYSSLYLGAPAPWSFEGSSACRRSSGLVWSGVDSFVHGTWRPHPSWRSSLVENGIKLTRNLRVPWWPSLRGKLRCPRKRLSGQEAILLLIASTTWTRSDICLPIPRDT